MKAVKKRYAWSGADDDRLLAFLASDDHNFEKLMNEVRKGFDCKVRTPKAVMGRLWRLADRMDVKVPAGTYSKFKVFCAPFGPPATSVAPRPENRDKLLTAIKDAFLAGVLSEEEFIHKVVATAQARRD